MTRVRAAAFVSLMATLGIVYTNCSGFAPASGVGSGSTAALQYSTAAALPIQGTESYVVPFTTGCTGNVNMPCVSVTICTPGTSTCQTINNLILDTGSYGLRVFSSLVTGLNLPQVVDGSSRPLAECVAYSGGASDWGPVVRADVRLGGETASSIPIQLIDSTFASIPTACTNPDVAPGDFNGILGVGALASDGGLVDYYSCAAGAASCTGPFDATADYQVANPVARLPINNNGLAIQMPSIANGGATSVTGYMVLGIGTQAHNAPPAGVIAAPLLWYGHLKTEFNGQTWDAFLDTGTALNQLPSNPGIPMCTTTGLTDLFCPTQTQTLSAALVGATGAPRIAMTMQVSNALALLSTPANIVSYNDLVGSSASLVDGMQSDFVWGLPSHYGRTIYVGFTGKTSSLGAGPLNGY